MTRTLCSLIQLKKIICFNNSAQPQPYRRVELTNSDHLQNVNITSFAPLTPLKLLFSRPLAFHNWPGKTSNPSNLSSKVIFKIHCRDHADSLPSKNDQIGDSSNLMNVERLIKKTLSLNHSLRVHRTSDFRAATLLWSWAIKDVSFE